MRTRANVREIVAILESFSSRTKAKRLRAWYEACRSAAWALSKSCGRARRLSGLFVAPAVTRQRPCGPDGEGRDGAFCDCHELRVESDEYALTVRFDGSKDRPGAVF